MIKAITGCPIAMEGKSATCAHFSPLGNIASAMCDLWSNESVQNVRLLSGNAPEAYAETLAYDCRLMNVATARNQALILRDWLTESDEWLSPQAAILSPRAACRIAEAIVSAPDTYRRTVAAGQTAVAILREGQAAGRLKLAPKERNWLDRIEKELQSTPANAEELLGQMSEVYGKFFLASSYGLYAAAHGVRAYGHLPPRSSMFVEACPRANPTMKITNPTIRSTKEAPTIGHAARGDVRREWEEGEGPGGAQDEAMGVSDPLQSARDAWGSGAVSFIAGRGGGRRPGESALSCHATACSATAASAAVWNRCSGW